MGDGSIELAGRVVLVVGATRGIGRALADACRARGAIVAGGGRATCDVTDAAAVEAYVAGVVRDRGTIDVAVYAAGLGGAHEGFAEVMATNAGGALHVAQAVAAHAPRARFVAISSGIVEVPASGAAAYVASKHALEGLVRALAKDARHDGMTFTGVRLGSYRTDMTRAVMPEVHASLPPPEAATAPLLAAMLAPAGEVHGRVTSANDDPPPADVAGANLFASPLGPSPAVRAALARIATEDALERYPDPSAKALRAAVAAKLDLSPDEVVAGAGASELLARTLRAFVRPGEGIVVDVPTWPLVPRLCRELRLDAKRVPYMHDRARRRIAHDLGRMLAAIDRTTRLVYLVSPANPPGIAIDEADFARFLDAVPEHVVVVVDEAYVDYVTRPEALRAHRFVRRADRRLVVIRTFSKLHALAGLRVGYALAAPATAAVLARGGLPFVVSRAAEAAAIAALADDAHAAHVRACATRDREDVVARLSAEGIATYASDAPFFLAATPRDRGGIRCFGDELEVIPWMTTDRTDTTTTTA